jgi:hypothetical protein
VLIGDGEFEIRVLGAMPNQDGLGIVGKRSSLSTERDKSA